MNNQSKPLNVKLVTPPIERPDNIQGESHARSVARNWITYGEFLNQAHITKVVSEFTSKPQSMSRTSFVRLVDDVEKAYGHLVVNRRNAGKTSKIIHKKPRFIELTFLSERLRFSFHKTKVLPVNMIMFDPKKFRCTKFITIFNISEHALARIISRSNATSLKDIAQWAKPIYSDIMEAEHYNRLPLGDFTLLYKDAIIPFTYMPELKGREGLIVKTWMPRSKWSARTLKEVQPVIDSFGLSRVAILTDEEFLDDDETEEANN
ncbi:MAG: hypothetical protein QNK36_21500 [Colwellia sp.]|nr:hypothetical protein [Colwellia sp.]